MFGREETTAFSNMTYEKGALPRHVDTEKGFNLHDAILKANARTKQWIAYSVVAGSVIVLAVSGLLVGLYLNGNLNRQQQTLLEAGEAGASLGGRDALTGGAMGGNGGKKSLDGSLGILGVLAPTKAPPIDPGLLMLASDTDLVDNVQDTISDIVEAPAEAISDMAENIQDAMENVHDRRNDIAEDASDNMQDMISDLTETLGEGPSDFLDDLSDGLSDAVEDASEAFFENPLENVQETMEDALETANDRIEDMSEGMEESVENLQETLSELTNTDMSDEVEDVIEDVLDQDTEQDDDNDSLEDFIDVDDNNDALDDTDVPDFIENMQERLEDMVDNDNNDGESHDGVDDGNNDDADDTFSDILDDFGSKGADIVNDDRDSTFENFFGDLDSDTDGNNLLNFGKFFDNAQDKVSNSVQAISDGVGDAIDNIDDTVEKLTDMRADTVGEIMSDHADAAEDMVDSFTNPAEILGSIVDSASSSLENIAEHVVSPLSDRDDDISDSMIGMSFNTNFNVPNSMSNFADAAHTIGNVADSMGDIGNMAIEGVSSFTDHLGSFGESLLGDDDDTVGKDKSEGKSEIDEDDELITEAMQKLKDLTIDFENISFSNDTKRNGGQESKHKQLPDIMGSTPVFLVGGAWMVFPLGNTPDWTSGVSSLPGLSAMRKERGPLPLRLLG
ncbi:hypothetical protein MAR_017310, partial [Mya arenaria]